MWTDEWVTGIAQELNPVKKFVPYCDERGGTSGPEIRC